MTGSGAAPAWIALVRHGITEWNERGLIQGHTDIPLSAAGMAGLRRVRVGAGFLAARWVTSPLRRAVQTAAILNPGVKADIHPALVEAKWGDFEGLRRDQLARQISALGLKPERGLDFAPPAGESPRQVQRRLRRWFEATAAANPGRAVVAVTHKGVIRSALSIACHWDMTADFGAKTHWSLPHIFRFSGGGELQLARLNCPWDQPPDTPGDNAAPPA